MGETRRFQTLPHSARNAEVRPTPDFGWEEQMVGDMATS
jgi:hypothetical protein